MNQPVQQSAPSLVPLLQWLENQKLLAPGTVKQVNTFADHVKGLGNALKAAGILK